MQTNDAERKARRTAAIAGGIRRELAGAEGGRALDLGAGAGNVSLELTEAFDEIVLVDVAPDALDAARSALAQRDGQIGARVTTALVDLSAPGGAPDGLGPVDVVYSALAMHHVQRLDAMLRAVRDVLRPGGRFFLADLDADEGRFHAHLPDFDGHNGFDRTVLAAQLETAGLGVDSVRTVHVDRKVVDGTALDFPIFLISATRRPDTAETC